MKTSKLRASSVAALRTAIDAGQVYAGWNPGCRATVNANTITLLGRAGLLTVTRINGNICGTITKAGVAAIEAHLTGMNK